MDDQEYATTEPRKKLTDCVFIQAPTTLTVGGRQVNAVPFVSNLGIILDSGLTLEKQVKQY